MSLTSRFRTAVAIGPAERRLALRAAAGLVMARAALFLFGFARVRRFVEATRVRDAAGIAGAADAARVRRALVRAARTVPGSTCLPQALVAARLLREAGLPAELTIGVAKSAKGGAGIDAHAWVRSGDLVVTGEVELERYAPLATFDTPR